MVKNKSVYPGDYHRYVFKKGKLLGKFEDMYCHSRDIPWHQDKTAHYVFSEIDIAILKQYTYESICDIGCGLGFFTYRLLTDLSAPDGKRPRVTGIDISPTAVKKASAKFPEIRFLSGDFVKQNILPGEKFSIVVVKDIFWYILDNLPGFMRNALSMIKKDGFLYVSQSFPASGAWVGKDIIDKPDKLLDTLSSYAVPVYRSVEINDKFENNPHLHFLGRLK